MRVIQEGVLSRNDHSACADSFTTKGSLRFSSKIDIQSLDSGTPVGGMERASFIASHWERQTAGLLAASAGTF